MRTKLLRSGLGFFAFAAGISLVNVLVFPYARENYGYGLIGLWLAYAAALALLMLAGRAVSRMRADRAERAARALAPAFTLLLFAVHLLMGYLLEYTPSGDNFMLYKSSQMLATDGNFDNYPYFYLYLSRFSNQWGFTLMLTAFYKLIFALGVTQTFYPLVLVQAVLYVFSTRATLRIARRLSGAKGELMTLLMLACCLPMYVAAAVLYTDTFSVPFIMVALDLALRIKDAQSRGAQLALSAACGAVVLIGCQIKMTVLIALMAAVIVWLLEMKPGRAMLCTALCAAIVGGGTAAVQHYMKNEVLDPEMVAQHHTPAIHWVMMSIPSGNNPYGGFSGDYAITWGMMEEGATHEEVMASIYSRMKDKIYTLRYPNRVISAAMRKDSAFMGDGTYGMTEMLDDGPVRENVVSSFVLEGRAHYGAYGALTTGIWLAQPAHDALHGRLARPVDAGADRLRSGYPPLRPRLGRKGRQPAIHDAVCRVLRRGAVPDALGGARPVSLRLCHGAAAARGARRAPDRGGDVNARRSNSAAPRETRRSPRASSDRHGADDPVLSVHRGQRGTFPVAAL